MGAIAALVVAMALVPVRDQFGSANVTIVLVLVIIAAAAGGRTAGAVTAAVAALSFNFFFTEPYLSLRVHSGRDVITVVLLVVVGVAVGSLAQAFGVAKVRSEQRRADSALLERAARVVAAGAPSSEVWDVVKGGLVDELQLVDCQFEPGGETGRVVLARSGRIMSEHLEFTGDTFSLPPEGVDVPVVFAGRQLGAMVLVPRPKTGLQIEERRMAVALADLLAVATARRPEPPDSPDSPSDRSSNG